MIALRVRKYAWVQWAAPVAVVTVLLAGVAYQELRISPPVPATTKPVEPEKLQPALPPSADAVAFPKDGFTLVYRRPGTDWDSPLSLRMPSDTAYRDRIVSVRDWATGKWVATVYLSEGVITTVLLPT